MAVGLIGYAAVAVFYAAFDLLAARGPLYTVDLLGKAVFRGLRDPGVLAFPFRPDPTAIFWYNGLHLMISLAIGLIVATLVEQAERDSSRISVARFIILAGFVVTVLAVGWLTTPLRPVLPWWSIVVANALAMILAGGYLLRQRPGLWRRMMPFGG
jgi:hypothetical protein